MSVTAHAGHWAINLLYVAPILVMGYLIVRDRLRRRSRKGDPDPGGRD